MDWRLIILLSLASCAAAANSTRCFECIDVPDPADCATATMCTQEQICVVEQFITSGGLVLYNSGCQSKQRCAAATGKRGAERRYSHLSKRADVIVCDECCTGDFCNNQGCGKLAPKQPSRGPLCFNCPFENSPEQCRTINKCDVSEVCMLAEIPPKVPDGSRLFESTCKTAQVCAAYRAIAVIGKRKRYNYCHVCCQDDFCNDQCVDTPTPRPTQPVTQLTTRPVTQAPTQAPTTTTVATTKATTTKATTTHKPTTKAPVITTHATHHTQHTQHTTHAPHTHAPHPGDCSNNHGYHYDRHSHLCYKFHYDHKTWDAANAVCKSEGGTLAIIDTAAKWNFLKAQIEKDHHFDTSIFIGARDTGAADGGFNWIGGHKVKVDFWGPVNDHIYIGGRDSPGSPDNDFRWPDGRVVIVQEWGTKQPGGGHDDCLYLSVIYDWVYIGGHDNSGSNTYLWPNGHWVNFNNWAPGQPDRTWAGDACMEIAKDDNYYWHDVNCYMTNPYICTIHQ